MDWDDLQRTRDFTPGGAYTSAKLANVLFTCELARRLADDRIVAHAMEPGVVLDSNFVSHADNAMQSYMQPQDKVAVSYAESANTPVWMATAEDNDPRRRGAYYA